MKLIEMIEVKPLEGLGEHALVVVKRGNKTIINVSCTGMCCNCRCVFSEKPIVRSGLTFEKTGEGKVQVTLFFSSHSSESFVL